MAQTRSDAPKNPPTTPPAMSAGLADEPSLVESPDLGGGDDAVGSVFVSEGVILCDGQDRPRAASVRKHTH